MIIEILLQSYVIIDPKLLANLNGFPKVSSILLHVLSVDAELSAHPGLVLGEDFIEDLLLEQVVER